MSFTEKIDVLELLICLLQEHELKLDSLVEKLEIVNQTIKLSPLQVKSSINDETNIGYHNYKEILVVDDDENLANTFKLILENAGYQVDIALNGLKAIDMLDIKMYDLAILDLNLPDMLGNEIAEEIESKGINMEFIYITGYSSLKDNYQNNNEVSEILLKPVNPEKLVETTTKYINKITLKNGQPKR